MEEEYKLGNTIQEFEELFGNVPFEDIEKIKKWLFNNFIPISVIQNKKSQLKEKRTEEFINYGYSDNYYHMTSEIAVLDEILEKGNK